MTYDLKCKCGREMRTEEDPDTDKMFYVCLGCGIWAKNCCCRPLDVPSLASFKKKLESK